MRTLHETASSVHVVYINCYECKKKKNVYTAFTELVVFLYWIHNSMNNLSSYCWLVDAKIIAPDKDLPVSKPSQCENVRSVKNMHWIDIVSTLCQTIVFVDNFLSNSICKQSKSTEKVCNFYSKLDICKQSPKITRLCVLTIWDSLTCMGCF